MLVKTGQWYWRKDELSYKEFNILNKEEKNDYLVLLQAVPVNERGSNDNIIFKNYIKEEKPVNNFFQL